MSTHNICFHEYIRKKSSSFRSRSASFTAMLISGCFLFLFCFVFVCLFFFHIVFVTSLKWLKQTAYYCIFTTLLLRREVINVEVICYLNQTFLLVDRENPFSRKRKK